MVYAKTYNRELYILLLDAFKAYTSIPIELVILAFKRLAASDSDILQLHLVLTAKTKAGTSRPYTAKLKEALSNQLRTPGGPLSHQPS
jgi:short subunit dehydrogenase-like uncharacterized protein